MNLLSMLQTRRLFTWIWLVCISMFTHAQSRQWTPDGQGLYLNQKEGLSIVRLQERDTTLLVSSQELTPQGQDKPLPIRDFSITQDGQKILLYTNSKRVWRQDTRGDYYVFDRKTKELKQLGRSRPVASLMFAKFSPDGQHVAYVSENNLYTEHLKSGKITVLTSTKGTKKLINGTFDWAYEEEFGCRDGFRWSPDSKRIAYWQIDANSIRDFYMINTTDSMYAFTIPIEYPKVGETPSACRIGVVDIASTKTTWMQVPGDARENYIPRMEWADNPKELMLQQLNRKQNQSKLYLTDVVSGKAQLIFEETDEAWVDVRARWRADRPAGWEFINQGTAFLWVSEKDGWRHIYKISRDGKSVEILTPGNYDVISPEAVDHERGLIYFTASPENATQRYLYRTSMDFMAKAERLTPVDQEGTHTYDIAPNAKIAFHSFSNHFTRPLQEWILLEKHTPLSWSTPIASRYNVKLKGQSNVRFFQVTTKENVTLDGWMALPKGFDPSKKYPVLFYVYGEPASQTVVDRWGTGLNNLYAGDMAQDGYIYVSIENRGAPAPKGREFRKSIYRKIGIINIRDQAYACEKLLATYPYFDASRIAVHGWSGGGSSTLNLLFQYPELYQTGISVAAVANQLTYDNIYQERYMGIPQENLQDFIDGSPVTHAKNLKGNLLYIHGTGDDNVHYQNAEMLVNELIKHNKVFQFMAYPNRAHGISEGEGTRRHLQTLFTSFLKQHCPPGGR